MRVLTWLLAIAPLLAADLEISRPARTWEFLDSVGPRSAFFGKEDGTLEAWVYPLKILKDLRLRFKVGARVIPAESIVRTIRSRPGSYMLTYAGDEFQVEQTLAASPTEPGLVMRLAVRSWEPVEIQGEFTRDFQLTWPASIGTTYAEWNQPARAWFFGADGQPYAAIFGGPELELRSGEYVTNYSATTTNQFSLGSINGTGQRWLAIAGSVHSRDEALGAWRRLLADPERAVTETESAWTGYLNHTVSLDLPDPDLQRAYDWSRLSVAKGMVDNPLLGPGLVAGYGPSKGTYRPGFAWFFGRDSFWISFALTAVGDFANARSAIDFVARYQRDDGKVPHEISQSASLLPWFNDYPWAYSSADATPLFVIAVRDYVEASGDVEFARRQWPRLVKAFEFMRSTAGAGGFPKNFGVGHGWVEGGPLLPVQMELYQAGCYVEALRSMAKLGRVTGHPEAGAFDQEFNDKRPTLDSLFWLNADSTYAFALDSQGRPVNQPSVLTTVPMWFGLLDPAKSRRMIESLAAETHQADWGMRIIGSNSPQFGPAGYHYGSVWPLFTGWASVAEYRYHMPEAALANLRANAWLALDGAGGNTTEVLSGATYSPLSTGSPHQIWSAAMVVSPMLRGMLGLTVDETANRVTFAPHLPAAWPRLGIRNIRVGQSTIDITLTRTPTRDAFEITHHGSRSVELDLAPAYAPPVQVSSPNPTSPERTETDWHPHFRITLQPGPNTVAVEHTAALGYTMPWRPPVLANPSANLKVISERWLPDALELRLTGLPGRDYSIALTDGRRIPVRIAGEGPVYRETTIRIPLKP